MESMNDDSIRLMTPLLKHLENWETDKLEACVRLSVYLTNEFLVYET